MSSLSESLDSLFLALPLDVVDMRIVEEGEIWCRGLTGAMFSGYRAASLAVLIISASLLY